MVISVQAITVSSNHKALSKGTHGSLTLCGGDAVPLPPPSLPLLQDPEVLFSPLPTTQTLKAPHVLICVCVCVCVCVCPAFPHWQGEGRSAVSFLSPSPTPSVVLSPPSALNKCMWTSADSMSHLCQSAGFKAHRGHLRVPRGLVDWQQLNEKGMHMGAQH